MRKNGASKYSYCERRATCVIQTPSQGVCAPVFVFVVGGGLDECDRWPTFASNYFDGVSKCMSRHLCSIKVQ